MKKPFVLSRSMLFNGAAMLISGLSVIFAVRATLITDDAEPCAARYANGTRMAVERNGQLLSAEDLQSRMAGTDWGLLDRTKVVPVKSGPVPNAMLFDLAGLKADDKDPSNGREGIGFVWAPRNMKPVSAACLAYWIYLPADFDFGAGGRLPGLMGLSARNESDNSDASAQAFALRYWWREAGNGDIFAQGSSSSEGRSLGNKRRGFEFPRGKWVFLEQELVLNAPGRGNGIVRAWIDGTLRYEIRDLEVREDDKVNITGVLAEIVPVGRDFKPEAKDQRLLISPFEVRW